LNKSFAFLGVFKAHGFPFYFQYDKKDYMASKLAHIQKRIYVIRGKRIMLDSDLAALYEVEVRQLNQAVKRNLQRFPADFMFRLTKEELTEVVTNCDHLQNLKYRPTLPYAFTEQGVAMLAAVLNSQKAIDVNIQIMRALNNLIDQPPKTKKIGFNAN
jgi:hypothetical protein